MTNDITRSISLVINDEVIQTNFLGKTINSSTGFSKEIFRNGRHEASVCLADVTIIVESSPAQDQYKARNGDRMLTINLGPAQLLLKGNFYTKDNYTASYEVLLELKVNNPSLFAQRYLQQSDPAGILQMAIIQEYDTYAARTPHNQLDRTKLRYDARYNTQSAKVGIVVVEIYKSEIYADPRRARINEMEQEAEVDKSNITITSEVNILRVTEASKLDEIERKERAKDRRFENEQKTLDEDRQMQQKMKQELMSQITAQMVTEMTHTIDGNMTVDEMLRTNPILQNMFTPLLQPNSIPLPDGEKQTQIPESTTVRERQDGYLPPPVPPQNKNNSPKIPIPESDAAEYSEIEGEVQED